MTETIAERMRIVIVEDDGITRLWMQRKIEEQDVNCLVVGTFPNGSQALEFIRGHQVDVVFTDVRMPVMDGMELLKYLRDEGFPIYKVIFSAFEEFDYVRWALKMGAQEYVPKSRISGEGLRQILEEAEQWLAQSRRMERGKRGTAAGKTDGRQQWLEREQSLREMLKQKDEGRLVQIAAEKHLDLRRLFFADIYFEKSVPRRTVLELLCLYLEQEGRRGECFQYESPEYCVIFDQDDETQVMEDLKQLCSILQSHAGGAVYLGVSRVGKPADEEGELQLLAELYRRALAARENRRFFEIPGCIRYSQLLIGASAETDELRLSREVQELGGLLAERRYDKAMEELERLLDNMKLAVRFHPAYLHALANRILSAYLYDVRKYPLNEDERRDVNGIELWLGWHVSTLRELTRALMVVLPYLDGLLRRKSGNMSCSVPIRQAMWFVEENYEHRITLDEVAEHVHLSPTYLSSLFKKETGVKFSTYLRRVRLEQARHLLTDTNLAIQEIADRAGFSDAAHLSRVFKERYGCSPMEYRRIGRESGRLRQDWLEPGKLL